MKIMIRIKTPNGQASGIVEKRKYSLLRTLLKMKPDEDHVIVPNADMEDNLIEWVVEGDIRYCLNIQRRVCMYELMIKSIMGHKWFKAAVRKAGLTKEQQQELKYMLTNMTQIKVTSM